MWFLRLCNNGSLPRLFPSLECFCVSETQIYMENLCGATDDTHSSLQLLEVCVETWKARNSPLHRDVLHSEVQEAGNGCTFRTLSYVKFLDYGSEVCCIFCSTNVTT